MNKKQQGIVILCILLLIYQFVSDLANQTVPRIHDGLTFNESVRCFFHILFFIGLILMAKQKWIGWMLLNIYIFLNLLLFSTIFLVQLVSSLFIKSNGLFHFEFVVTPLLRFPDSSMLLIVDVVIVFLLSLILKSLNSKSIKEEYKTNRISLMLSFVISLIIAIVLIYLRN